MAYSSSRAPMRNKFSGVCCNCGGTVLAGQGFWSQGKVYHPEGECESSTGPDFSHIKPDEFQQAVIDSILLGASAPHVLVDAKAGSGKTTIGCMGLTLLHQQQGDLALAAFAFGNEDGKRLRAALPSGIEARTHHSLCMGLIRSTYRAKHKQSKVTELLELIIGPDEELSTMREQVRNLLAMVQADAVEPGDLDGIRATLHNEEYDLCVSGADEERVIALTSAVLEEGLDVKKYGFTFDDALYLCAIRDIRFPHIDVVLVDEVQDWNNCQLAILGKWVMAGARVIAIGDPDQSLYAFRGAQPDAFDRVRDILVGRQELLMPYCRRSGSMIVNHAAELVSDIRALPDAPSGELEFGIPIQDMLGRLTPGDDMVLSRTNARLVQLMYTCIRMGIPAYMRKGSQEAGYLCWFVDMLAKNEYGSSCKDVGELMFRAQCWLEERGKKSSAYKLEEHRGRVEVLSLICERVLSVDELKDEIRRLFKPPAKGVKAVVLSTIHGAKGGEAERVWNISADLMPHPRAKTDAQKKQEKNADYVCRTRAKRAYYVTVGELVEARKAA